MGYLWEIPGGSQNIFFCFALLCLLPDINSPVALLLGIGLALTFGNPFPEFARKSTGLLLKLSVIGLGFGMSVNQAIEANQRGFLLTVISILSTLGLGAFLTARMKLGRSVGQLIASGTAICGGSAIAAIAPVIKAKHTDISVALGVVFILNSLALFIFPVMGHWLSMTQEQFGLWAAIAIHDTSSVVGASASYGQEALAIATTVKLGRALWIIPLSLFLALSNSKASNKGDTRRIIIPWFIGLFILAMLANSFIPQVSLVSDDIVGLARQGLVLTLFFIGSTITRNLIRHVGFKPMLFGTFLWIAIASLSLALILLGF